MICIKIVYKIQKKNYIYILTTIKILCIINIININNTYKKICVIYIKCYEINYKI